MSGSVGNLCECCNHEVSKDTLELRWVATKKAFLKTCKACRDRLVTFTPEEWEPNDGTAAIGTEEQPEGAYGLETGTAK